MRSNFSVMAAFNAFTKSAILDPRAPRNEAGRLMTA
jgi:hypothetical protein